jgi:hypothetical protein
MEYYALGDICGTLLNCDFFTWIESGYSGQKLTERYASTSLIAPKRPSAGPYLRILRQTSVGPVYY